MKVFGYKFLLRLENNLLSLLIDKLSSKEIFLTSDAKVLLKEIFATSCVKALSKESFVTLGDEAIELFLVLDFDRL